METLATARSLCVCVHINVLFYFIFMCVVHCTTNIKWLGEYFCVFRFRLVRWHTTRQPASQFLYIYFIIFNRIFSHPHVWFLVFFATSFSFYNPPAGHGFVCVSCCMCVSPSILQKKKKFVKCTRSTQPQTHTPHQQQQQQHRTEGAAAPPTSQYFNVKNQQASVWNTGQLVWWIIGFHKKIRTPKSLLFLRTGQILRSS